MSKERSACSNPQCQGRVWLSSIRASVLPALALVGFAKPAITTAAAGSTGPAEKAAPASLEKTGSGRIGGVLSKARADEHNELFRRGSALVTPHLIAEGRKLSQGQNAEGELWRGIQYLDKALTIYPGNWAALWVRGKAYQALGDHFQAYESSHGAYAINRTRVDIGRELSLECLEVGMSDEAVTVATSVALLDPKDAGLLANLALALLMRGDIDAASVAATEALLLKPEDRITRRLRDKIDEVRSGKRPRPKRPQDLLE